MAIEGLTIIGESINDSVPTTAQLYDAEDFEGIKRLAKFQQEGGAKYIDINVGTRESSVMVRQRYMAIILGYTNLESLFLEQISFVVRLK